MNDRSEVDQVLSIGWSVVAGILTAMGIFLLIDGHPIYGAIVVGLVGIFSTSVRLR